MGAADPDRVFERVADDGDPPFDPVIGRLIDGRYQVVERIGEGGFAVVYGATQHDLQREVAVKVLQQGVADPHRWQRRFQREAKALAMLSHPHIVNLIDFGILDRRPYLVMERLAGRTLRERMDEGPIPPDRAFVIVRQILHALACAHDHGLVHRDLKPTNVFLQSLPHTKEHVKILDFGFAKFFERDDRNGPPLTQVGTAFGTPAYIAPEQASGDRTDGRGDLYSTAVLLFEMCAGRRPFEGSAGQVLRQKLTEEAPRLAEVCPQLEVRPELDALLQRCLARYPDRRFASAQQMLDALEAIAQPAARPRPSASSVPPARASTPPARRDSGAPEPARRMPWALFLTVVVLPAAAVVLLCAGVGTWLLTRSGTPAHASAEAESQSSPQQAPVGEPEAEALPFADPWASQPVPGELEPVYGKVRGNEQVEGSELARLRAYAANHPDDARPHLLAGHVFSQRGWRSDAMEQYERAYRVDSQARGDPRMLVHLVAMVTHPTVGERAATLVKQAYGQQAMPVVDAALERPHLGAREQARLEALRSRLAP